MFKSAEIRLAKELLNSILRKNPEDALDKSKAVLEEIFGKRFIEGNEGIGNNGVLRYKSLTGQEEKNIQYWGLLYEGATTSGVYENFSLVAFPDNTNNPTQVLLCFGIGTGGITDDANLLEIPGVKRSIISLLKFVKRQDLLVRETRTFVKDNLADEFSTIPKEVIDRLGNFSTYDSLWKKYGKHLPSACVIKTNEKGALAFLTHILLYGKFRKWGFKKRYSSLVETKLFPKLIEVWREYPTINELSEYIPQRKYIILQGPPGTGKTDLAEKISKELKERGVIEDYETIQFHSSITYDDFVEGIKPATESNQLVFVKNEGPLIRNVEKAANSNKGYLLIVDEINRGDLAKILGECIYLFEPGQRRESTLRSGRTLEMPDNFYLIGTMNTADRTIAIIDFAIRRRFAFIDVWPSAEQLEMIYEENNSRGIEVKNKALEYFNRIQNLFFEHAVEEDLNLQPGHTYFIAETMSELKRKMKNEVTPLLREYLAEGRLSFAKNEILAITEEFEEE